MPCPLCGDICRCAPAEKTAPRWLPEIEVTSPAVSPSIEPQLFAAAGQLPAEQTAVDPSSESSIEDSQAWRNEVAARLSRYQARRKPRPPRYPSLRLHFEEPELSSAPSISGESSNFSPSPIVSNHALALDSFTDTTGTSIEVPEFPSTPLPQEAGVLPQQIPVAPAPVGKLIEFPRSWTPTPPPLDELAERVTGRPRILEAPEVVPPPPALGGITIEPAHQPEVEKRPGIDVPLQSAPLARRIFAAAIDGVIIAIAGILFGFIFWKLTAIRPPRLQIAGLVAGLTAVFWAAYQYLLVVYSGSTPGLRLARLEMTRFDGSPAGRHLRRWRVLASFLSAASLGMGYAWVFLDEDALCWHDRITHTYLAPKK